MASVPLRRLGLVLGLLLTLVPMTAASHAGRAVTGPLELARARVGQSGPDLVVSIEASEPWSVAGLDPAAGRSVCLTVGRPGWGLRQLCLQRSPAGHLRLVIEGRGGARAVRGVSIARRRSTSVTLRIPMAALELRPGLLAWQVRSTWSGPACADHSGLCDDAIPAIGLATLRLRAPQLTGCARQGAALRSHGSTQRRRVALTFDDGPSPYTAPILRTLSRQHAHATFFELGDQLRGRGALARRILREGDELGNHTWNHAAYPAAWQLRNTSRRMRRLTGFQPCLFRPPYGAVGSGLVSEARRLHMTSVLWNVDPRDWSLPGAGAIAARVLAAARPGSIVVMHDGGGPRRQTVVALPRIIHMLHARHYQLVTVSELLGYRPLWRPPG